MGWMLIGWLLLAAMATPPAAVPTATPTGLAVEIRWSMPERFGPDADDDGLVDLPNTAAYVHNRVSGCDPCPEPRFIVRLEAVPGSAPVRSYAWTISGDRRGDSLEYHRVDPLLEVTLPEGDYRVEVRAATVIPWGAVSVRRYATVTVSDLLVVAIGDSYASGEGNPEVRRFGPAAPERWGDGGDEAADRGHAEAHRSTVAWPARTALALEQADPHSSVTFVSVAASGDRIDNGILVPSRQGTNSQIDQVAALVGERPIDLLLVQEGGNSIGFSRVVRALVEADPLFDPVCYHLLVEQALDSVRDGNWSRGTSVRFRLPFDWSCVPTMNGSGPQLPGLAGLEAAMNRLADGLSRFAIGRVVLVGYPDPTGADTDGARCREIVGDVTPPIRFHEISRDEGRRGVEQVVRPLNAELAAAATAHGWLFVGGIAEAFASGHGYCAPWPDYGYPEQYEEVPGFAATQVDFPDGWYRNPGRLSGPAQLGGAGVSWYRNAAQSSVLQGPAAPYATSGTLHPNEVGHAAIARMVLARLQD